MIRQIPGIPRPVVESITRPWKRTYPVETGGAALAVRPRLVSVRKIANGADDGRAALAGPPCEPGDEPCSPTMNIKMSIRTAAAAPATASQRRDRFDALGAI